VQPFLEWLDERTHMTRWASAFFAKPIGSHVNWLFTLGSVLLFLFAIQLASGILLAAYYSATPEQAHQSVQRIMRAVPLGWLMRGLHHWGAALFIVVAALHLLRVVLYGAYKRPREVTWLAGVGLLVLILGFAFTGYLLPWDQKAYWATVVGTYIAGTVPWIGGTVQHVLRGGPDVAGPTLTRFYAVHTLVLPALTAALIALHVYLVQVHGVSGRFEPGPTVPEGADPPSVSPPEPFYPHHAIKDATAIGLVYVLLVALAWFAPAPLEVVANPLDSSYVPRPEWYFYPLYETLKFFDGSLRLVGTVVVPVVALLALLLLPFLDRSPVRDPFSRPIVTAAAVSLLLGCVYLVGIGLAAQMPRDHFFVASTPPSPETLAGALTFEEQGCETCHAVFGQGGRSAPDLWRVGGRRDRLWLAHLFKSPDSLLPAGSMPTYDLPSRDLAALIEYVAGLDFNGRPAARVSRAVARGGGEVYRAGCLDCHESASAPAFTGIGRRRGVEWLTDYLNAPAFHRDLAVDAEALGPVGRRGDVALYLATR
jgi:ubiquinol-cytochrome c reductase cytochrome b subunit